MDPSMSPGGAESLTARDLLHLYLDLRGMVPDLKEWSEDALNSNPPRLVRLKQLKALFRAFKIPWNLSDFCEGSFIEAEDPRHVPLLKRAAAEVSEGRTLNPESLGNQLPTLFSILLAYREGVASSLSFSGGVMEASGLYYYAHRKVAQLNQVIGQHVHIVEDILVDLVSPEAAAFTLGVLVRDYGYPEDDLFQIDGDFW